MPGRFFGSNWVGRRSPSARKMPFDVRMCPSAHPGKAARESSRHAPNAATGDPSEFVRDLLRQKKLQIEAAATRDAILAGYQDAIEGRTTPYDGDLRKLLKKRDP